VLELEAGSLWPESRLEVELALARGKQLHDKRETLRKRTQERETRRAMGKN
jgi:SsrA-binding protein